MLHELWDVYQQGQINSAASNAEFAKRDAESTAARLHSESLRLEAKIDALALVCQALWEIVREKTDLTENDIEQKMTEIDLRDGREDGRIAGVMKKCPACNRPSHSSQSICIYCGASLEEGHLVEKSPKNPKLRLR
ncbi:MAG: hypothetical protein ACO1PN_16685 [Betaproteobacteria bacterium]